LFGFTPDISLGERLRDAAIDATEHSNHDWVARTLLRIHALATAVPHFTTDAVWGACGNDLPIEQRAMGAAMRAASRLKICYPTDRFEKSKRPLCHRHPRD
jgi:hypothetical protein